MSDNDKRRCLRFRIELPAWYTRPHRQDEGAAVTLDISATGACFISPDPLDVGRVLVMRIKLPHNEIVRIKVKVIWVKALFGSGADEYRIGVRIIEPVAFDEAKFVRFCAGLMLDIFKGQ